MKKIYIIFSISALSLLVIFPASISFAITDTGIEPKTTSAPTDTQTSGTCNYFADHTGYPTNAATCPPTNSSVTSSSGGATTPTGGSRTGLEVTPPSTGKTGGSQIIKLPNPLGSVKTIPELIGRIVDWLIFIASIAILPFMIVWGAYQLLTAGDNPEAVTSARHTITWAVAGYALLLISKGIEFIIRDILTRGA